MEMIDFKFDKIEAALEDFKKGIPVVVADDEWTVSTQDNKPSAHFEHTVLATEDEPLIITQLLQ